MLTRQVKQLILIQMDIIESEASQIQANTDYPKIILKFLLHVTKALDQRKEKHTKFLKFWFQE